MLIEDDTIIFVVDTKVAFGSTARHRRMMCLSQTTGYAVYALSRVGGLRGEPRRIRDIAEHAGLPKAYLARIVSQLAHHGIVHSKRGYRGGIVLALPAGEISLLQIVEAVEGKNWLGPCLLGLDQCGKGDACPTQAMWQRFRGEITRVLGTTTLADVIRCESETSLSSPRRPQSGRRQGQANASPSSSEGSTTTRRQAKRGSTKSS
jgi:Rrf2 family protein